MPRAALGMLAATLLGCEQAPQAGDPAPPAPGVATTTQPVAPPATTDARCAITIRNVEQPFPFAVLRLRERDGVLRAQLFSNDPPEAIRADYQGNSFYFDMELDVQSVAELSAATWTYKAPTSDAVDSFQGIFLEGTRIHMQPQDVQIRFEQADGKTTVHVVGAFLWVDRSAPEGTLREMVQISESLAAKLQVK